jgi:ABC-type transport system involved in multi-copper enzyme maturation permease subunit
MSRIRVNPVLGRELRERMRSGRAFVVVGVFLALLILTVYLVYQGTTTTGDIQRDLARQTRLGRDLYEWVLFVMTSLVLFFVPGLSAGAIAGERERQTLLPLQVTLLRPRSLIVGKVLAGLSFLMLLLVAALPVLVIAYLLGGINLVDSLKGLAIVAALALVLTVMVASLSALARRVQTATLLAYGFVALLILIGPLVYVTMAVADGSSGNDIRNPPAVLLAANPIAMVADATAGESVTSGGNPLAWARQQLAEANAIAGDSWWSWFPDDPAGARFRIIDVERAGTPAWLIGLGACVVVAVFLCWLATRRLRTPAESER